MNLNISTSKIQNNKNFATSIQPYCSGNCQKSHDSSAQKQLIASCMRADIIEPSFNNYSNNKTYSNATHNKKIATNVVVKSKKPIHQSKQIHSSYSANVQNSGNGTNPVNSTFYKHLNLKKYSNSTRKKQVTTARSAAVQSTLCKGTNTVDAIFNKHSNPAKYSNVVNTQMITHGLRRSLKKPILCQSRVKEIHTSNSAAIPNVTCNKSNIIEPTFNKHSNLKTHSDIILNEQLTTNLPFIPKESISSSQHAKQIHLTNSDAIQNESSCSKTVYVKGFSFPKVLEAKSILYNSDKIKTNESNQTKLSSSSLNSLQTSDIITSISRICTTSDIPDDSESNSGLFKRQATRVSDSNLKCSIPSLKENNTKADSFPNSSNVPQVQDDFIKPNNSYETVHGDKMQITNASQTNLKCIKPCLKGNKNTDTILNISNEPKFIDEFIKSNNLCQNLVGINKDSQKDKRQIDNPSQTNLKFTKLSAEQNNTKTNAAPNIKSVPQVEDDFINPNNSCQTIASNSKQKISLDDTNISKKVLFPKKSISSYESNLTNSSCSSSSKIASLDKSLGNSLKTSKFLERNNQFQNRPNIEETKRCSSESVSLPMLHTPIIHLPENTKNTLTIIPLDDMKAKDEKDNTLKSVSLSPSSQTSPVSLQITLKKHAVEEHSSTKGRDSITDIIVCQNSINDSVKTSKNISCLNSSISPVVLNFDKQPELYEKISKYVSSAVVERKPAEPEVSDNTPLFHTNKPQKIIRQNIVYTDDRETILRLLTLNEHEDDSETKKNALKNVKHSGISTFCDNESFVIPENMKKSNISSEFTIKLQDVGNKVRCWPKPVITLETIAFNKHNVSLSELVTKENYPSGSKNEPLNKSIIAEIADRTKKIPLSQNLKEISEKISSDYEILTNVSNAFDTQNSDKNNCSVNLNHTSQSNSKSINVKAYSPSPVSTANMTKNIVSCPEKTQTIKNNSEKLPPSLLISPQKNGISLNSLQKCDALVTNVGNESKDNSEILNISPNISQNNFKNQEFSVKDNHAKANEVYQEKNVSQIEINCIESNNLSQAQRINQIFTGIPHKRKIPVLDADANIPNKAVCVRNSSSSSESVLLNSNCNSITKFTSIDKAVEEFQNKNYDKNVRSPTRSLLFQNKNKVEEMKEWAFKSVPPAALLHTKDVLPVKNSQESVSCTSVQNIIAINRKFDILKRYWLSKSENQVFSSCLPSMNTMNSPEIKAEDSIATSNVTFDVSGTSDNMPSLDPPLLTTVMNTVNDYGLPKKVHKKDSSTLIEMEPSLPKMPCNLSLAGSFCDPKCHAENMEARLTSAKQIGISPYCQIQSLVIPEKNEDMSLEITIKIKDVNKKIGLLERTGVFNGRVIADSYLSKPFAEKIDFTTTSKSEPLVKVEILNEKVKEKCFSSPHNLKEMPKSPPCCINNEVTSLDCVNDRNEIVNSKPTENIPPISENILNDTRFVKTIQANVANFGTFKTNKIFDDFNKSEALETVKSSQASTTSNDGMINNVSVTENKNFEIHGISVGSCQTSSKTKSEIYSDHSFHENTHDEADKNKISCDLSRVSGNVQGADFILNNTFMPLSGLEKEPLENTTLLHIENKSVGSSADNTHKTISSENELCNVNSEENLDLQLLRLLLTEVQNTYGKVFLKNYIKNCVKSSGRDSKDDIDKSDKSSYTSDVGEQKTLNQELVLQDKNAAHLSKKQKSMNISTRNMTVSTKNVNATTRSINIATKNMNASTRSMNASTRSMNASTRSMNVSARNINVPTRNTNVSARNMNVSARNTNVSARNTNVSARNTNVSARNTNVSTRNTNVSTRNTNVSARNMNVSTKTLNVPRQNIPNVNNYLKNIQPANSFQRTNSTTQNFLAPCNRTKATELPFNRHQNLKANSNVVLNRQTPNVSVMAKQPISQQQHFKPIRSSNSVQYLNNTKTSPNSQLLKTVQQSSTKNKSSVNLNHATQSSSMLVNIKKPNQPLVSNAKTSLMKKGISCPAKTQNSPEKLPPSLLNSLQKSGISVSSLQKCGISVTNVGSDSKNDSELLNRQATVLPQRNLNYAKFSVKEKDAKINIVPQASNVPQVQNNIIKSNSLCQATVRGNKRKLPPTDTGIPNKSICIRKPNSLSANMSLSSNCNSVPKIASVNKTFEKSQNKTFVGTPNSLIKSIPSRNQHNVKEIKVWPSKSVSPAVLPTKVVPIVKNPQIIPRENIKTVNQKYDILKNVSLPSNPQKQLVSSSVVNKNTVNSYSKPKVQVPVINSKSIVMNSAASSTNTPFLNSSLSVTVVNPDKKFDLCSKNSQPVVSSSMVETKLSQSKVTNYLTRKNQPLSTNRKSIDLTNRDALLSLLALCEPEDSTDAKDTKVKNAKASDNKITEGKNVKPSISKDSKETNIEPIVISDDSENESSVTPKESTKTANISPKFTIKLKEVYKTIRYWPKPVVLLERIKDLDKHIVSNISLSKPVTRKTDISKSKKKLPVKSKTAKKKQGKNGKKVSQNLKNDCQVIVPQYKNSAITLSDVMKYVDEDFNLLPVENSCTLLSENKIILPDTINDDSSKTAQNSLALLSNNEISFSKTVNDDNLEAIENSVTSNNITLNDSNHISFSETVNDDDKFKTVENSVTSSSKISLMDTLNDSNCLEPAENFVTLSNDTNTLSDIVNDNSSLKPVENSVVQFSNNKINLSEIVGDDDSLKPVENAVISNNTNTLSDTVNDNNSLVENSVTQFSNNEITLSEAVDNDVSLNPAENSSTLSNNTNTLLEIVNDNDNLKPIESSVSQFSNNKITLSEAVCDDSLKLVEKSMTLSNNINTLPETVNDNNLTPVENSEAQFSNNKITLSGAVGDDDSLKPVENSLTLSNSANTLLETVNDNDNLKSVECSVSLLSNNKITLSEAVGDDDSLKSLENSSTLSNNINALSETVNDSNNLKTVESSVAKFLNNKTALPETGNEDVNLKNFATLSSNPEIIISKTENEDASIKLVENSVTSSDGISVSKAKNEKGSLKPVEKSVTLMPNKKFPLFDVVNDNISLTPVEVSVVQLSNDKITLSEVENENISLNPDNNSVTLSSNNIVVLEVKNKDASVKPEENSVILISNEKSILSDMVNDNASLEPVGNSMAQLTKANVMLSDSVNEDVILKTIGISMGQLSSNSVSLSEVINDDVSLKPVENTAELLSDNSMTILDELSDTLSLKSMKGVKSTLSEDVLIKSANMNEDDFASDVSAAEKLFYDTAKFDSFEMVKSLLTSTIEIVETIDTMVSDISVNGNKIFENNGMSSESCEDFIGTINGICSDLLSPESMCKETIEDQISLIHNKNENIQVTTFISEDSSAISSDLQTELYNDNANYSAEQSAVSIFIYDILKKVESMLADDETITEVQCKTSDNAMDTSEVTPVSCQKFDSLINQELLLIDDKTNCSADSIIHNILSSENELHAGHSENKTDFKQNLSSTKVQEISDNTIIIYDIAENLSDKHVKPSLFDDECDVDNLNYGNNKDDLNVTLNEAHNDQVTSPKLSLKRNRTELTPDRKLDERSGVENVSKKIKFDEGVLGTELSNKMAETSISTDTTSKVSVNTVPSTSFASTVPVIEVSDEEPFLIPDEDAEFQMISSMNSDAPTCNIPEERKKKLKRILDFAGPLMPPDTSDHEKKIIAERLMKQLDTAQQSYVESENFNFLLDHSFEKIKMKPHSVFTFLNEIKRELKKHKKENKKAIKGSAEDNRVSLTDDSISKDILFIDSSSSLPSKDKVALSDALHTSLNFTSSLKDFFKVPEKQEPDSASCSSELTNFFSTNKNINDSGSNLQTAANSNTKVVSDNHVTSESSSSVIALEEYSEKSNASKSQSLYTQMSKKFKSAEDNTSFLSNTAISESTSIPVSGNDSENKKVDLLSQQSNRRTSIDDSRSNLQTCANSDKKLVYDHFVKNDFSSSAIASAVGLCSKELKTSKLPSLKEPLIEKLNSTGVAHNVSTSIPERGVSRNNVNREFDLTSLPSTSRCHSPSDKFLFKNDISFKMSRSSSSDSLSADTRTLLEKRDDDRNAKRIKKLEKLLKELDKAIKRCQQQELTLDDMDKADSAYLQESRYKKRFVATYKLLCKLKRVPARTGRIIEKKFRYQGSRYTVINKAIEKLIDSKKIHEKFPDYSEVFNVIKQVQDRDDLGFNEIDISNEAKRVFEDIGEQLKERRYRDQRELVGCYLTDNLDLDEDPAERDDRLKKTLDENSKKFNASINQIIDHFVEKQQQTPAGENDDEEDDGEDDDEKDDDEKEEDEEEIVANIQDDSDDLPGTAPASPENIGGAPVVNIIERDDDDIVIINYSDKSTDPEEDNKEKQTFTVNKPNISQSVVLEDSSSGDLPSLQELVDKSKIDS